MKTNEMFMDGDQALMTFGPLGVVVWRGECTLRGVGRVKETGVAALAGAAASGAPGVGVVIGVVEETSLIPSAEARRLSAEVNDQLFEQGIMAYGGVFPDQGFGGAWKRGVITGLNMLAKRRYPFRVFQRSLEACQWFAELPGLAKVDWAQAAGAVDRFRQDYAARYPTRISKAG